MTRNCCSHYSRADTIPVTAGFASSFQHERDPLGYTGKPALLQKKFQSPRHSASLRESDARPPREQRRTNRVARARTYCTAHSCRRFNKSSSHARNRTDPPGQTQNPQAAAAADPAVYFRRGKVQGSFCRTAAGRNSRNMACLRRVHAWNPHRRVRASRSRKPAGVAPRDIARAALTFRQSSDIG